MDKFIAHYYEEIFSQLTGNKAYVFEPKEIQLKQIKNFIIFIEKEIGKSSIDEDFIFYYMVFQFERRKDQKTKFGVGRIPLNHVIGKTSWEKWLKKPDNWKYWADVFIENYSIKRIKKEEHLKSTITLDEQEEKIKEYLTRSYEDNIQMFCSDSTTLYHPDSPICVKCVSKDLCIELLKEIYPKIYVNRKSRM